ncbi:hypothetical protein Afe04nite_00010 [Asanoa ferruginea]|nr:hypothetical protein Afe04nite_00010 [Asanoa ferruginea]
MLLAAGAALAAAFELAPRALPMPTFGAYSEAKLHDAVGSALVEYWRSGTPALPVHLTTLVDYWFQWHAVKVAISALLVIVLALLTTALWQKYLHAQAWYAAVATAATVSTVFVIWVLSVNIQVTALPLIPLLGLLPGRTADGKLAQVLSQMHEGLTKSTSPHAGSPALTALLGQAERYQWVTAAILATLMVATGLASAHFWKRRFASDPSATRVRFMHSTLGVITALTACLLLLLTAGSVLAALEPATSLLGVIGAGVPDPHAPAPLSGWAWARRRAGLVGVPATIVTLYGISVLGGAQAAFAKWLLAPTGTEMNRQVEELARSRSRLVDSFEAERRRIERDLHDGAQQHLVLLTMKLGLAERHLADADGRAGELVGEAHEQARLALTTLRDQIRGIHPQILTDFGLAEAVRELAERCPIPVEVDLDLPRGLPPEIESTAYFVVSEALTNAVRHAAATRIQISGRRAEQRLALTIVDNGRGGAEPSLGTGMRGLADRVAVVAGTLEISSPQGGPTTVRIDLPCRYE